MVLCIPYSPVIEGRPSRFGIHKIPRSFKMAARMYFNRHAVAVNWAIMKAPRLTSLVD